MGGGLQDPNAARRIANADKELMRHLKDEFAYAAQQVADRTQAKILTASSKHPGPLRAQIAATVQVRARRGPVAGVSAQIRSNGELMPPGKQTLNAYANAGTRRWARWRHPVFGPPLMSPETAARRPKPVTQEWPSARGWFDDTVRGEAQRFSDAVSKAVDETQRYLEGRL